MLFWLPDVYSSLSIGTDKCIVLICLQTNKMNKVFLVFSLFLQFLCAAQSEVEGAEMKFEKVVRRISRSFPIKSRIWNCPSSTVWNEIEKSWTISIYKYKHSSKGQCKYTNGCTIVRHLVVVINDIDGKIISKKLNESVFYNYE